MDLTALLPAKLQPYAKTVIAVLGIVVTVLTVTGTNVTWLPILVQVATALGVYSTPNVQPGLPEDTLPDDGQ